MEKLIDISQHNGNINFEKVKQSGINKVIIRVGWIGNKVNHTLDTKFEEYIREASNQGMGIGIYVYSYCLTGNAILSGATWVYNMINKYKDKITLPVFLDLEDSTITGLNKNELTNQAKVFCDFMIKNGFKAGVYANKYWWQNKLNASELTKYKVWLAQYANISKPEVSFRVDLWQYTSSGQVNGINGRVDMNQCFECENINKPEEITGGKGDYEMKIYSNGSTKEDVYQDANCTKKIGYLNPREKAECYGIINGKALIVYNVDGTNNKKTGFVEWLGGLK